MVAMDRLQHSHLGEDYRPAVFRGLRHANLFRQPVDGFTQRAKLATVGKQ
jgi:hypothetical protein